MEDVIELLREHCKFESEHDVYVLLAVARKKDHPNITNSQEIVFREVIKTEKDIERKYNKIHTLTRNYNKKYSFYVYVNVNPRDVRKAFFRMQELFNSMSKEYMTGVTDVMTKKLKRINNLWMSALMKKECRGSIKNFMIDLDNPSKLGECCEEVRKLTEIIRVQKTKNGYHLIVKPFNRTLLPDTLGVEIKTDELMFVEYVERK